MSTYKTKAPSGLTIARKDSNLILSWKANETTYSNIEILWRVKKQNASVSAWNTWFTGDHATSYTINWSAYGDGVERIEVKIAAIISAADIPSGYDYNAWSDYVSASYSFAPPDIPSLTATLDADHTNVTTFTWNVTVEENDNKPFKHVELQTILVKESNETDGSRLTWKAGVLGWETINSTRSSSKTIQESTPLLAQNSYTRWVRVRSVGGGGVSPWRYAKHVYAKPWAPTINKVSKEGDLNWIRVNWTANQSAAHPIDSVSVDWAIATPLANQVAPANPSWTTARTIRDGAPTDEVLFLVDQTLDLDECLWVRVTVIHDRDSWNTTGAQLVSSGKLKAPTGLSVTTDASTFRATVRATNNSDVPDSKLAVVLRRTGYSDMVVGVSAAGSGEKNITVQCPDWSGASSIAFGVYAFQGSSTGKTASGYTTYAVTANMKSAELWEGGAVPLAPTGVTAAATETIGEVMMTWNWTWLSANRTELSWSQNPNAWESTEEPETYIVTDLHIPKWRISGLEAGVVWYFRVRLAQEVGDEITYGPYCDAIPVDLSSAPEIPVLTLSAAVVTAGEEFTASWAYITTDGTVQASAEICEATIDGTEITYGSIVAHTTTAQHVDISMPDTWTTGTEHSLCVRVASVSGRMSPWSDPVTIAIADPITCTITQTSLVEQSKNLIPYPYLETTRTANGLTFTDNGNGTITVNGTATATTVFQIKGRSSGNTLGLEDGTEYTISGCPNGGSGSTYKVDILKYSSTAYATDYGSGASFTYSEATADDVAGQIRIVFYTGTTVSNLVFKPMIRLASETDDSWQPYNPMQTLTVMPLTATVTGAGEGGVTTLAIERADDYFMARPDGNAFDGYAGETIATITQDGESQITIGLDNLFGRLDDGAPYVLIATTLDGYGQTATASIPFWVYWTHQAGVPSATVQMDTERLAAKITPIAPEEIGEGDVCDIYRLSADSPELIIRGGTFGETYVDPYPAIGPTGGHRIVHRTVNGDYITADNHPAWVDTGQADGDMLDTDVAIIDFGGGRVEIPYNVVLDNSWQKDFQQTTYLGGAIQGDWNPAVSRTGSVNASIVTEDVELIQAIRRLAVYSGICHVRTQDGSSYSADVQVSDGVSYDKAGKILEFSLNITRIDPEGFDGMTLEAWEGRDGLV